MRIASFSISGRESFGLLHDDDRLVDLGPLANGKDLKAVLSAGEFEVLLDNARDLSATIDVKNVTWLSPITQPSKIFCIGLNYDAHRLETGREETRFPTIFTRFADTLVAHGQPLCVPDASKQLDYEGELAVIIGRAGRHIAKEDAFDHVAGYSCFNDGSVRDWQRHTSQFTPGKNFPATGGFGPSLVTRDAIADVNALTLETRLNGETLQEGSTASLIFDIPFLIAYISTFTRLEPGDVISTGTPAGVGVKREPQVFLTPGDRVEVEISGIGVLANSVVAESGGA